MTFRKFIFFSWLLLTGHLRAEYGAGWGSSQGHTNRALQSALAAPVSSSALPSDPVLSASSPLPANGVLLAAPLAAPAGYNAGCIITPPTPTAGGNVADEITPAISSLAAGLLYDPVKIYDFVRNYIDYECYYGLKRGAHLTLLEGRGNDWDQAALLTALLRASGHSPAYGFGALRFTFSDLQYWCGLSSPYAYKNDATMIADYGLPAGSSSGYIARIRRLLGASNFLYSRGFPHVEYSESGTSTQQFAIPSLWVELSGKKLFPAFKRYSGTTALPPSADDVVLSTASGYSKATMLADAQVGASITADSATSLNYVNISNRLKTLTQTLTQFFKDQRHKLEVEKVIPQRRIIVVKFDTLDEANLSSTKGGSLTDVTAASPWLPTLAWSGSASLIGTSHFSKFRIRVGNGYVQATKTFGTLLREVELPMCQLQGKKISLIYSGNTGKIYLGDTQQGADFTVSGASAQVELLATHNHYEIISTTTGGTTTYSVDAATVGKHDQREVKTYTKGTNNAYIFTYAFANPEKYLRLSEERLEAYRRQGLTDSDWQVKTEILNILGTNWFHQKWLAEATTAPLYRVINAAHHQFGRVAQDASYYIDVGLALGADQHRDMNSSISTKYAAFTSMFASAMEHGVTEQLQGDGKAGVSTIKALYLANSNGTPVYRATNSNWSTVRGSLTSYNGTAVVATTLKQGSYYRIATVGTTNFTTVGASANSVGTYFVATGAATGTGTAVPTGLDSVNSAVAINAGQALVPQNAAMTLNSWTGTGYMTQDSSYILMAITGGLFGGQNTQNQAVSSTPLSQSIPSSSTYAYGNTFLSPPASTYTTPQLSAADPVDMASGAFYLDKQELTIGAGSATRGLSFTRSYNSNRRFDKAAGLGYGWTHNYYIRADKRTSVRPVLNETLPLHASPFYVALVAGKDIYDNATTATDWLTSALIVHWLQEQLKYNAVGVTIGNKVLEFVKMPDGTFEAPAGVNMTLSVVAGNYRLVERNGSTMNFDANGRIANITDLWGKTQVFTHDAATGQLQTVKDAYNRTFTFNWVSGKLQSLSDGTGRTVTFGQDAAGDMNNCTDVESKQWSYVYDGDHRLTRTVDPSSRTIIENDYDSLSRVVKQRNQGLANRQFTLAYSGYCNVEVDPQCGTKRYLYDRRGRAIGTTDALGNSHTLTYDGHDRQSVALTPLFEGTVFTFDKFNNLTKVRDAEFEEGNTGYDSQNRPETITDKRGKVTTVNLYNAQHQPRIVTAPLGRVTTTTYITGSGEVDTVTDPENNVTDYDYDTYGRVRFIKLNGINIQEFTYTDLRGDPATSKDALGRITSFSYNKRRQLRVTTLPAIAGQPVAEITNTYDNEGNVASTTDPRGNGSSQTFTPTGKTETITAAAIPVLGGGTLNNIITTAYDTRDWGYGTSNSLGHTTSVTFDAAQRAKESFDPLNRKATTEYDGNNRPTQVTDPLLRVTKADYTPRGEREKDTDGLNKDTAHFYNENGNRWKLTNRRGKDYLFGYDDASRHETTTTPTGKITTQTYWNNDLLKTITEPSTQLTTFNYDTLLRLQTKVDPLATITYGYQGNSQNLTTVTEGAAVISRTYDERKRLKTFTNADGDQLQYEYDAANNLTCIVYPTEAATTAGQFIIGTKYAITTVGTTSFTTIGAANNIVGTVFTATGVGSGTGTATLQRKVTYTYNARNLLETVTDWAGRVTTYRYDRLGRLLKTDHANGTSTVRELDAAGQLLSQREIITATGRVFHYQKFGYDEAGQVKNKFTAPAGHPWSDPAFSGTYDDDNRLLTANGNAVVHDDDGNMTNGPITATTGTQTLAYNARNQLLSAAGVNYTYDAEGRRRTMVQGANTTRYTIDPNGKLSRLLVKHNPDGTKTYYVYGLGLIYEASKIGVAPEKTITHHYDQVGSTVVRTDGTGNDVGRAEYSPYGQITWQTGNMATPFLYNGKFGVMTDANGLLHMRARFYSPYLMRFLNPDPIGFSGGQNWFAYGNGNPISVLDPFGLFGWGDLVSIAIDFVPVAGSIKSAIEVVTGTDLITGEEVNRGLAAAGLVAGLIPGGKAALRGGSEAVELALKHGDELADAAALAARHGDEVPIRVTQFYDDALDFPVNGTQALHSQAKGLNRLDGIAEEGATFIVPKAADDISDWTHLMTGRGNRSSYIEFDAYPSELAASGLKPWQSYIPGAVDLSGRGATVGNRGGNVLDATARQGSWLNGIIGNLK